MVKLSEMSQTGLDTARDVSDKARIAYANVKDATLSTSANVKDAAQSTYANLQATLGTAMSKMPGTSQSKMEKNLKMAQKNLAEVQDALQGQMYRGWNRGQHAWHEGMHKSQSMLKKNTRQARKNLYRAQKNVVAMQASLQDQIGSGLTTATTAAKDLGDSMQKQYAHYVHKRRRARMLFRWGIVAGIVLALLFAPRSGREVRAWLVRQWQQYKMKAETQGQYKR